jgi:predicted component of type VI protein secretion system
MTPQSYQLVIRSGPTSGISYDLTKSEITIGRESTNDIVINDAEVSRKHARMLLQPGGYMIEDLGSTNGTFVNGQRLMGPRSLQVGDVILFGENVSISYETSRFDPDSTIIASPSAGGRAQDFPAMPPSIPSEVESSPRYTEFPRQAYEPDPQPAYADDIPSGPAVYEETPAEQRRRSNQNWILAGCGCLILLCLGCVGVVFVLDQLNLLCDPIFRPLTNLVLSIVNPILGWDYYCPPVFQ